MVELNKSNSKPLVGFFPCFPGFGETFPIIKIAKRYVELGGEVVIFSHGGEYEYLAKDLGYKIIRIEPIASGGVITKYFLQYNDDDLIKLVKNEASVYKNSGINALVQSNVYFGCILGSRFAKIPLISVGSGGIRPYFKANLATFPDNFENYFTYIIPKFLKNRFYNWYSLNYKGPITKKMNRLAKKLDINLRFKCATEISYGDYTFICDFIDFLGLKPTQDFPAENYIGTILTDDLIDQNAKLDSEVENHLKRSGKSILLTMGGSFTMKEIFLKILEALNETKYNVIATYSDILNEKELPQFNENILLRKFIPSIKKLHRLVDMSITHGGRGTIQTAAYSGKPLIGFPLHSEQQNNLENLASHGSALRLSKTFFKKEKLLQTIEKIFNNYDIFLENAQTLAYNLPESNGDKNAAKRIAEILQKSN